MFTRQLKDLTIVLVDACLQHTEIDDGDGVQRI